MFKDQIKRYVFISSILINLLIVALIFIPKQKDTETNNFNESGEKVSQKETLPVPTVAGISEELYLVKKVIDGDTIALDNGEVVRYIGIDTPEFSQQVECYSQESTVKNKELVESKMVRLEKDVSERDRYGRLLRYVYVEPPSRDASSSQATFVNEDLVRLGYAEVSTYPPDVKYKDLFLEAEKQARENNLGLWSACTDFTSPRSGVVKSSPITSGNINCLNNTYNCSDFQTQAEAQNVFEACGGVPNDIHQLDRDKDGRVCETLP